MNRTDLIDAYAQHILDDMDMNALTSFAYDCLVSNLNEYRQEDLITEITDIYPELLDD